MDFNTSAKLQNLKAARQLATEITESGAKLFDMLAHEKELKKARDNAIEFLDSISRNLDTNSEQQYIEKCIRNIIDSQERKMGEMEETVRQLKQDEGELMNKIKRRRTELERAEKRLKGMDFWMRTHDLPKGPVEGGVGGEPWLAKPEKIRDMERILSAQPQTRFILIGDNNHVDHEVFAELMARYPDRIEAALVHRIKPDVAVADGIFVFDNHGQAARFLGARQILGTDQVRRVEEAIAESR